MQLDRGRAPAQRADVHAAPGGRLGRDLEHRERRCRAGSAGRRSGRWCLRRTLPGGRSALDRAGSRAAARRARSRVARWSTISACAVHAALGDDGAKCARARVRSAHRLADVERLALGVAERRRRRASSGRPREVGRAPARARARRAPPSVAARAPRAGAAGAAARARRRPSPRCAHSRGNSAQNTRAHVSASASARCETSTSMPSDSASARELALARERVRSGARARPCTAPAGRATSSPARSNAWRSTRRSNDALWPTSTRPRSCSASSGSTTSAARRLVDHRLRDPGEALDAARQRRAHADERLPAVVQLAAADEHGADLGQLAGVAGQPVRLGVDDEELGVRRG